MSGYEFTADKGEEKDRKFSDILDRGLDEISEEQRQKRRREKEEKRDSKREQRRSTVFEDKRTKRKQDDEVKTVRLFLSHDDLDRIIQQQGIETRGYNYHLEAVLRKRRR